MNNSDRPAGACPPTYHTNGQVEGGSEGLTKREYFAGQIMQGFAADPSMDTHMNNTARTAVLWADALLAALEQEQAK